MITGGRPILRDGSTLLSGYITFPSQFKGWIRLIELAPLNDQGYVTVSYFPSSS